MQRALGGLALRQVEHEDDQMGRITSYNVCYTKLLRDLSMSGLSFSLDSPPEGEDATLVVGDIVTIP